MSGNVEGVRLLLRQGADVNLRNGNGDTPLERAIRPAGSEGKREVVELLLAGGADANARTKDGETPLHTAAAIGRADLAKLLLDHAGQVDAATGDGGAAPRLRRTGMKG